MQAHPALNDFVHRPAWTLVQSKQPTSFLPLDCREQPGRAVAALLSLCCLLTAVSVQALLCRMRTLRMPHQDLHQEQQQQVPPSLQLQPHLLLLLLHSRRCWAGRCQAASSG